MLYNTVIQSFDRMATKTAIDAAGIRPERQAMEKSGSNTKKLIEQAAIKEFMEKGFMEHLSGR